jgi:hypothetical protein
MRIIINKLETLHLDETQGPLILPEYKQELITYVVDGRAL